MGRATWQNPRIVATFIFIFLTGAVSGALLFRLSGFGERRSPPAAVWREAGREITLQKFKRELDLTPEQAREVETVLDDFAKYYQMLQAQMDDVRATGKERIVRILDEKQQQKFKRMMSDLNTKQIR